VALPYPFPLAPPTEVCKFEREDVFAPRHQELFSLRLYGNIHRARRANAGTAVASAGTRYSVGPGVRAQADGRASLLVALA
jgi:hypothetical protein